MIITKYQNGQVFVTIDQNGTKTRESYYSSWDLANKTLEFPESIDIKITDYCDLNCKFCHENSTIQGKHADILNIVEAVDNLSPGIELAIGGGNPLDHPDLEDILIYFKSKGFISNLTVNAKHLKRLKYYNQLSKLLQEDLLYGLGISYRDITDLNVISQINYKHKVIHCILGEHSFNEIKNLLKDNQVLLLGYKQYGRGVDNHSQKIEKEILNTKSNILTLLMGGKISFDNLAIKQLDLKNVLDNETWNKYYMGDDGEVTMYYDAINNNFAVNSTSIKRSKAKSAKDFFLSLKRGN